jgi:hypothetical protein
MHKKIELSQDSDNDDKLVEGTLLKLTYESEASQPSSQESVSNMIDGRLY